MENEKFSILIRASRSKVWEVLWSKETYGKWTRPFGEGSMMVTDWTSGSLVRCIDSDSNGMLTRIVELRPMEFVCFEPVAIIHGGVEEYDSKEVQGWKGADESYTLTGQGSFTELAINMHFSPFERTAVMDAWPQALEIVKNLSEKLVC